MKSNYIEYSCTHPGLNEFALGLSRKSAKTQNLGGVTVAVVQIESTNKRRTTSPARLVTLIFKNRSGKMFFSPTDQKRI